MTKNPEQLHKALALLSRATFDVRPVLYAAGDGDGSGSAITPEQRDELLKKLAAGEYVAVDIELAPAFEQQAGVPNRNFVRFRDGALMAMGITGRDKPFLRDHSQWNSLAVAGRVLTSKTTKVADGHYQIHQRARLTATWAVDLALRDLLHAVSIGWEPTGPVECSVCQADIRRDGWVCHWPGMRVSEMTGIDGKKKFVGDRNGKLTVEWVYTAADLIETSMCPIGGVRTAGVGGVRAALAAVGVELADDEIEQLALDRANSTPIDPIAEPVLTTEQSMSEPSTKTVVLTEAQFALHNKLAPSDQAAFLAKSSDERDAAVQAALAADPVVYTTKDGTAIRKSDGAVALMFAKQADASADREALAAQHAQQERATRQASELAARAKTTLAGMHGADEVHIAILGAIEAIQDETLRASALQSVNAWVTAAKSGGLKEKAPGLNPETPVPNDTSQGRFDALAATYASDNKCSLSDARAAVLATEEGRSLYNAIQAAKRGRASA